jgi:hypothetical protein
MIRSWNGRRRVAFIPVWNRLVESEPPANWVQRVRSRAFFEPNPTVGIDRSLQRWIQTASSGRAYIEGTVFPTVVSDDADTVGAGLNSLPASHGFDYAMIILPHSVGPHRGGFAWWDTAPVNGISKFARVAMFDDMALGLAQNVGVWAMELLHIVTEFGDLYNVSPQLNRFDVMACSCGTHPSAHTKSRIGWLDDTSIRTHPLGNSRGYTLHAVSLPQPPPPWRASAVRIQSKESPGHFVVEARMPTDVYDGASSISDGISSEGVIVYEVRGDTELYLRTPVALQPGQRFEDSDEGLAVTVGGTEEGGFSIRVQSEGVDRCKQLAEEIKLLRVQIEIETDVFRRKQLISALTKALKAFRANHCLVLVDPATEIFDPPVG